MAKISAEIEKDRQQVEEWRRRGVTDSGTDSDSEPEGHELDAMKVDD